MANASIAGLNRVKYAGLDFDTHEDDLRARIQANFAADYNDFATSSLGIMLLDVISFGLDTLSFYLDRRATDMYLATARTRKAVSRLSRQLGYKMGGAVSASVDLIVNVTNPQTFTVPIPQGFAFNGPNGLTFTSAKEVDFAPGEQGASSLVPGKTIPCFEGTQISETFVSDGTPNQVFQLKKVQSPQFVASGSVDVTVDGTLWAENDFITFDATNQYEVGYNDDPPTVSFGDGVAGNIPVRGASVVVSYVATSGLAGIVTSGTITTPVNPLVVSSKTIALAINNPQGSTGGDDAEDIEHAKSFAGRVFKSRQVAITRRDYEALAGAFADPIFGRVAVAQALSARSASADLELQTELANISSALAGPVTTIRGVVRSVAGVEGSSGLSPLPVLDAIINALSSAAPTSLGLEPLLSDIAAQTTDIQTKVSSVITAIRATKNKALDVTAQASAGTSLITSIPSGASDQLTPATAAEINGFFADITTAATVINSSAQSQIDQLNVALDDAAAIGFDTVTSNGSDLYKAEQNRLTILNLVGTNPALPGVSTGLYASFFLVISPQLDLIDPTLVPQGLSATTVATSLKAIYDHVDKILAADCQANLVVVPILARDAAGFYSAPSNSLIQSLQAYLDGKKEVTQTVSVVSGADSLVEAVITVRIGVNQGFSPSQVATAVGAAVDGILRNRQFGVSLYVSDLIETILGVTGVNFTNATINGYMTVIGGSTVFTGKLDVNGNLIIDISEVITKGQVTIQTPETVVSPT